MNDLLWLEVMNQCHLRLIECKDVGGNLIGCGRVVLPPACQEANEIHGDSDVSAASSLDQRTMQAVDRGKSRAYGAKSTYGARGGLTSTRRVRSGLLGRVGGSMLRNSGRSGGYQPGVEVDARISSDNVRLNIALKKTS